MEIFKKSNKSICHKCSNFNEKCSMVSKYCETDNKIGLGFVVRCSRFNKELIESLSEKYIVKVDKAADSRIEMMGGGFKEVIDGKTS